MVCKDEKSGQRLFTGGRDTHLVSGLETCNNICCYEGALYMLPVSWVLTLANQGTVPPLNVRMNPYPLGSMCGAPVLLMCM
jgi:hypothetical protein